MLLTGHLASHPAFATLPAMIRRAPIRLLAAVPLVLQLAASPALADNAAISVAKLAGYQAAFNAIPPQQRDKLVFELQLGHSDKTNHVPIRAWVDANGRRVDVPIAPDGAIQLPDRPDWAASGVMLQTDQPRHSLDIEVDVLVRLLPGRSVPVSYLLDAVQQADNAMRAGARQLGGYLAMLAAPSAKSVAIDVAGCCKANATLMASTAAENPGQTEFTQAPTGTITIPLAVLRASPGAALIVSAPPSRIGLFGD